MARLTQKDLEQEENEIPYFDRRTEELELAFKRIERKRKITLDKETD
jgi:hypothetical protein